MLGLLVCGFWLSPQFKIISAGVAIFLFGMLALEEGFRAFTGGLLEGLLQVTTDSTWKSLTFGVVSTTLMQSSSLVSVITISFLSTGLIGLVAGIGIVFGANLGTTTGAWLIAGLGMKVKLSAYAMPLLVFGIIGVLQKSQKLRGVGYILAGLGFLFLGIHYMKEGFDAFRENIDLTAYALDGYSGVLLFTLIGAIATVIMQSSHATLVLIITALSTHQISYENALALAIGANIGTTITAIIGAMSANEQGKRLAAAHLLFNVVTAAIAIAAIYQMAALVDWISALVGIADNDYTLKLAVFHSVFNSVGILIMLPFIGALATRLQQWIPEKTRTREKPIYLTPSAAELSDTAIEAVRKETLRLFDNAFTLIAHGLSLHREDILSERSLEEVVLRKSRPIPLDFDEEYEKSIKGLYSDIVAFISRAQTRMQDDQAERLFELRVAGHEIVDAIKNTKHMQKNLSRFIVSPNRNIRQEYNKLRLQLGNLLRELVNIRDGVNDPTKVLSLDNLKVTMEKNDATLNGQMERLIREDRITAQMATSLMNDSAYAYDIARSLIKMGEQLFASGNREAERVAKSIALTPEEVQDIAAVQRD